MPQGQFPMGGAPSGYGDPRGRREERPGPPPPRRWAERDPPPRSAPHQPLGRGGRVLPPPAHAADASRRYVSLLGPSERPTTVVEYPGELWVFTQPWELAAHDLCVRMAVHRCVATAVTALAAAPPAPLAPLTPTSAPAPSAVSLTAPCGCGRPWR